MEQYYRIRKKSIGIQTLHIIVKDVLNNIEIVKGMIKVNIL